LIDSEIRAGDGPQTHVRRATIGHLEAA
jgi:hypothetical protein